METAAFLAYEMGWMAVRPWLSTSPRMAAGLAQRQLRQTPAPADLWIQAASAGEAYLARAIVENLSHGRLRSVLVTTQTEQGMAILKKGPSEKTFSLSFSYFPFDQPSLMAQAVAWVRPRLMVLLETELWPGLLRALKRRTVPVAMVNARMSPKSLRRYRLLGGFWRKYGPEKILAISESDADRFAALFGRSGLGIMPNIKFDRIAVCTDRTDNPLAERLPGDRPLVVLGSVRQAEEDAVQTVIARVLSQAPQAIIGLFPRHMHRIAAWERRLTRMGVCWERRSDTPGPGTDLQVLLGDRFGELDFAYARAQTAFVGGSLAPLGGQNFLEPLIHGVRPVIGPSWEHFAWAGAELFRQGLVRSAPDPEGVADQLLAGLNAAPAPGVVRQQTLTYIRARQGGIKRACELIYQFL